jgi:uncharacterized protein (DUF1778 family)
MAQTKATKPKDTVSAFRVPLATLRRAEKAARQLKLTRNGFIVAAVREKADKILGAQSAA